ncbi:Bcr/CflA family multidrug efflux MFS transporter [Paludisphaera mucosa]|uniref:Bcr/CflA family multidrug efflux MFS transporter n=1 Tax=Paludisphaera mucosa TaxID=3030827 RepID=A0ABT6FH06_9BACT|nr:Bcr/CflA family multidrug efflux MFS transporter [Paludisphaera mucosa]MDG3006861.1 Bcr/CflA family multidrug efflux MFS transporter [Paludisphaera mucosa]
MAHFETSDRPGRAGVGPGLRFLILLGLLDAFGPLGIDMYLPAFPEIARDLHAEGGRVELTLSLFLAGLAIGQLICGPISDRIGRRKPLLFGAAAFALASVVCAFTRSIEALIAARFVMGLAGATGMVVARAVVRDSFEEADSARVYSMLMLVIGVAPIISPTLGAWVMTLGGWPAIFWSLAAFACVCGLGVLVDMPETLAEDRRDREPAASILPRYAEVFSDRRFLGYAVPSSLALGMIFAYVTSAPSMFLQHFRLSPTQFNVVFACNAIGLIGAAQVNRRLTRWFDTHAILRGASLVNAAASLMLPVLAWTGAGGFPAFLAMIFVALAMIGLILPNATAAVMAPFPDHAGVASALLGALQFAVGAAAGAAVGMLGDGTPRSMALTMAACATGSLAVSTVVERRRVRSAGLAVAASGS